MENSSSPVEDVIGRCAIDRQMAHSPYKRAGLSVWWITESNNLKPQSWVLRSAEEF